VRQRVAVAESFREARQQAVANAELPAAEVRPRARMTSAAEDLARRAVDELALSGRGYDRLLRVSRTIADLAGSQNVDEVHLSEALGLRRPVIAS
jgi:magnesium chelatase family protein